MDKVEIYYISIQKQVVGSRENWCPCLLASADSASYLNAYYNSTCKQVEAPEYDTIRETIRTKEKNVLSKMWT